MKSTGTAGLMRRGSPPSRTIASRIAARSPSSGMPEESGISTRVGWKAISRSALRVFEPARHGGDVVPS